MAKQEMAMLKIVDIKKKYVVAEQDIWALKGINLEFRTNEFVSILGPSGCGKTTMLNLIGGLDKYSEGDLVINGTSTKNFTDSDWDAYRNNSIGFVFQSYNLIPHLTILGNVELALTLSGVSKAERTQRATEVLGKVGLEDHIGKKPNQLSGGQMQRVAIARALINNPDIILADEPTGALDSETSVQIMELLKEVASEKLVIMVTHNPELADEYSSRIVKFKDGLLVEDSNPFKEDVKNESNFKPKKTAMPFQMALSLSLKNLLSKKARTLITAFAGSIGIIGISCVLALSTGFQNYVDKMQTDMMSEYPLEITKYCPSIDDMKELMGGSLPSYPSGDNIFASDDYEFEAAAMHNNQFTLDFINYLNLIDSNLVNEVMFSTDLELNVYTKDVNGNIKSVKSSGESSGNAMMDMMMPEVDPWAQMVNQTFLESQYDKLEGRFPTNMNEVVLFVDSTNSVSDEMLYNLGLITKAQMETKDFSITFNDIIGHSYSVVSNDDVYKFNNDRFNLKDDANITETIYNNGVQVEIVGIYRINKATTSGSVTSTIGYTEELTTHFIQMEANELTRSEIVKFIENPFTALINPFTGSLYAGITIGNDFMPDFSEDFDYTTMQTVDKYGGSTSPSSIKIFPKTFEAKTEIKAYITEYNNQLSSEEYDTYKILYLDAVEMMVMGMNTMIASISYVLIAFTSISLLVSSVMIGIITYVSVIERTKEIGVLRSIGARKKDISRVFNAETIIIGFTAGMLAITFTYLISIPINIVVNSLLEVPNISSLNPLAAVILVLISISLTLIAGLIPSSIAAKKDPVTALRSE